jgi:valyl-tRNA synthetase
MAPEIFLKPYDPAAWEPVILDLWEKSGYADPDVCIENGVTRADAETYSIVLPPPNVTGILHMGSALMIVIEDILIRHHRMRGYKTLWIPGTDSAAIATQAKVESEIYKAEKKTRHDLGRAELMKRIDVFVEQSTTTIIDQTKKMGASLDWSRYAYTMDEKRHAAVLEAFVRMHNAGLIYRGDRIVNWDPKLQTTVSDEELEYVEQKDAFHHIKYGPFEIGTVRPETKCGDKYVVMHPDDDRYKMYEHGQQVDLEWINGPITATIIKDKAVDMEFGSGVMTITPAHSMIDFDIAQRHGLDIERMIDDRGILLQIAGEFSGQHIKKARAMIVEKLKNKGLIVRVDEGYTHNVATNGRGGGTIEPQIKRQWFVAVNKEVKFPDGKMATLKSRMREAVDSGGVEIVPNHFQKTYFHWIDNLRDWCISRQIWFGHRMPVWYCTRSAGGKSTPMCETPVVSKGPATACPHCGSSMEQDPDTLDTWFSSGLWTVSTLGWPEMTSDLKTYHPTAVLETGYDILFFWVARMILMSQFHLGQIPFRKVYLHGIVRDGHGRKISKSLGNNIDPLNMAAKYGMDAVRMSLIAGMAPGTDSKISEEKIRGYKHFANKLWNITRFVLENYDVEKHGRGTATFPDDKKLLDEMKNVADEVAAHVNTFRLDLAADTIYHFMWDRFAAEILEESKPILKGDDDAMKLSRAATLDQILVVSLKLLHPIMPFVTEAIWQQLPNKENDVLMVAKWPASPRQGGPTAR